MHVFHVAGRVRFGYLRVEGRLEVAAELTDGGLGLHGDTSGSVDNRTEEHIQQQVQSLRKCNGRKVAEKIPACEACHFAKQRLIPYPTIFRLLEMPVAIPAVT